jgi:scaffold protein (connect acetoacetyl-CoA thiolase and HMG-CoA synthase)
MEDRPFSDVSYEQFLKEEKLMGSGCKACETLYVPPRPICIQCYGSEMDWVELRGDGRLAAFTCISVGPPFMIAKGYDRKNPYCSGVVELEEGARVDARIEGVDTQKPETIQMGIPLKVKFLHQEGAEEGKTVLMFEPA